MGVLLDRARKALGGNVQELPPAEPYDIACICGQRLNGFRIDHRQFVPCSVCGQVHVVLPISPYPRPIVYETPANPDLVNVEVVRPERPMGVRVRVGMRRTGRAGVRVLWGLVPPARWFSAVRLTIMAMLLIVGGTIWLTVYWSGRGTASDLAAMQAGWMRDIEAGDFASARTKLDQAVVWIRRYGRQTRGDREIEQLAAEVSHLADLLDRPLEEILQQRKGMSNAEAERFFRDTLKNAVLVMDTYVGAAPASEPGLATVRVEHAVVLGQDKVRIDVSDLKLLATLTPQPSTRVLFAARIHTIESGSTASDWTVRLVPDSGVWLTDRLCAEKLGWPLDESTRTLLESQSRWVLDQP